MFDKEFFKGVTVGVILTTAVTMGMFAGWKRVNMPSGTILSDAGVRYKLNMLEDMIDESYLEEKDDTALEEGLYTGLLYGLGDPYSRYYTADDYEAETADTEGSYSGIGVAIVANEEGGIRIEACYEGSPAEKAGVEVGDVVSAIDDTDITEMTTTEVVTLIKKDEDKSVALTIHREDEEEPLVLTVDISDVELPTVFHEMLDDQTGYLRITQFSMVTPDQFQTAMSDLNEQGMKKLVVDVRGNPGGVLDSVCDVLKQLLPKGLIVYTEDKHGKRVEYKGEGKTPLTIPMAVLVNENSASAAEIFAGAIKDYEVGTIVGTTTYGKGIVQTIQRLWDGSAVKLTTSKYYTPKGHNIHKTGIAPDVEVKLDTALLNKTEISHEEDNQLQEALKVLSGAEK